MHKTPDWHSSGVDSDAASVKGKDALSSRTLSYYECGHNLRITSTQKRKHKEDEYSCGAPGG